MIECLKEVGKVAHSPLKIGILALQGGFDLQRSHPAFHRTHLDLVEVKTADELRSCDGLVLPGGESGTILRLIGYQAGFWQDLQAYCRSHPCWGICAGSILLAEQVENPVQASLGAIPITASRNAYGRQKDSKKNALTWLAPVLGSAYPGGPHQEAAPEVIGTFIRAPQLNPLPGKGVEVLAKVGDQAVALCYDRCLVTSFHPELGGSPIFHNYFLGMFS